MSEQIIALVNAPAMIFQAIFMLLAFYACLAGIVLALTIAALARVVGYIRKFS
jgi:hypothetical protein